MHAPLTKLYRDSLALLTDLYQLTMLYGYWREGLHRRQSIFHLFYRKPPFGAEPVTVAGLATALDFLEHFQFSTEDIQYLGGLTRPSGMALFPEAFLHYLQRLRFSGDVFAIPEGQLAFPGEPILRVEAPLGEAQLLETALLTLINYPSLIATKARRIVTAAAGKTVLEFGLRRAQGIDGGLSASRAAYIGGCSATSNLLAGKYFGIPVKGTHAHSWVMVFEQELAAFMAYTDAFPTNSVLLVDTYNTLQGVEHAMQVGMQLRKQGMDLAGIRLDSGDLLQLSKAARNRLDAAGFTQTQIVASGDMDEYRIQELLQAGAPIDTWGVGTRLITAFDQPALGGVYKLAALQDKSGQWQDRMKLSNEPAKRTLPGPLQVWRGYTANDQLLCSLLAEGSATSPGQKYYPSGSSHASEKPSATRFEPLLIPIMIKGQRQTARLELASIRTNAADAWAVYQHRDSENFTIGTTASLIARQQEFIRASTQAD